MHKLPTPIFYGTVDDQGVFQPTDKSRLKRWLRILAGKNVQFVIQEEENIRSVNANRYYFGIVVKMIADETGETKDRMHDILKAKFLSYRHEFNGEQYLLIRSTAALSTEEFWEYVGHCTQWAAEFLNLVIPAPGEVVIDDLEP